jgi:hypothetical protein
MNEIEKKIEDLISQKEELQQEAKTNQNPKSKLEIVSDKDFNKSVKQIKASMIESLRKAKTSHMKWISDVQILIRLGDIKEANSTIPVNYTNCEFGKWYYGDGQKLSEFSEYNDIEEIHQLVHDTYLQIYSLYNKPIEGSIFNSAKKQKAEREVKAKKLEIILKQYSKLLFELLITLEKKIKSLSNEQVNNLV